MQKKISIITISLNNPDILKTLKSVIVQDINPSFVEHIIVEGDPNQKNNRVILNYLKKVRYSSIYICERDTGRFNAMNKGIKVSKGDYLLFLNAGDAIYHKSTLKKIFSRKNNEDILYGDILANNKRESLDKYIIDKSFFIYRNLFHQATLIKSKLITSMGNYNESYKIAGDFEFFVKAISQGATLKYIPNIISIYDTTGISSTNTKQTYAERALVIYKNYAGYEKFFHLIKYLYYKYIV